MKSFELSCLKLMIFLILSSFFITFANATQHMDQIVIRVEYYDPGMTPPVRDARVYLWTNDGAQMYEGATGADGTIIFRIPRPQMPSYMDIEVIDPRSGRQIWRFGRYNGGNCSWAIRSNWPSRPRPGGPGAPPIGGANPKDESEDFSEVDLFEQLGNLFEFSESEDFSDAVLIEPSENLFEFFAD